MTHEIFWTGAGAVCLGAVAVCLGAVAGAWIGARLTYRYTFVLRG